MWPITKRCCVTTGFSIQINPNHMPKIRCYRSIASNRQTMADTHNQKCRLFLKRDLTLKQALNIHRVRRSVMLRIRPSDLGMKGDTFKNRKLTFGFLAKTGIHHPCNCGCSLRIQIKIKNIHRPKRLVSQKGLRRQNQRDASKLEPGTTHGKTLLSLTSRAPCFPVKPSRSAARVLL